VAVDEPELLVAYPHVDVAPAAVDPQRLSEHGQLERRAEQADRFVEDGQLRRRHVHAAKGRPRPRV
jgi:hypothetical protein